MDDEKNIQITYCAEWGYLNQATGLAAAIEQQFGLKPTLKEGHGGIFEVTLNNDIIYNNKNQCGRLPTLGEIFSRIYKGATNKNNAENDPSGECTSCGGCW